MRNEFLPFYRPLLGREEITAVAEVLESGWISTGPKTKAFEEKLKEFLSAPSVLCVNSCTAALHLSLIALRVGPNDEVITTPMTFSASVNVIEHVQARPILVDVDQETLNIDPVQVEKALTPKTRAILVVHYAGHPADLDSLRDIASRAQVHLIEDAAHAFGAEYKGKKIGSGTNPVCFSFYATKNLTTGEGGALAGNENLVERARVLSLHGLSADAWQRYRRPGKWRYEVEEPGFKYNMSDIQAAIGLCQLRKIEQLQERRRGIAQLYDSAFKDNDALQIPSQKTEVKHSWHLYVLRLRLEVLTIDRDQVIDELAKRNIGSSVHFIPIHLHPYYRRKYGYRPEDFPVCYREYLRIISLPLGPWMSDQDAWDVIEAVTDVTRIFRR